MLLTLVMLLIKIYLIYRLIFSFLLFAEWDIHAKKLPYYMANILPIFVFYMGLHVYFLFFDEEFLIAVTSALFYFSFYKIMGQSLILMLFIKFLFVYINFNSIIYIGLKVTHTLTSIYLKYNLYKDIYVNFSSNDVFNIITFYRNIWSSFNYSTLMFHCTKYMSSTFDNISQISITYSSIKNVS